MRQRLKGRYSASLTKGSLKVGEIRVVASLVHSGKSPSEVIEAILDSNLLQKRSPESSTTFGRYLLKRLGLCPKSLVTLIAHGTNREATQGAFIATLLESALMRDFLEHAVTGIKGVGRTFLTNSDWTSFLEWLESQEPEVIRWTVSGRSKLRQNVLRVLAEAEILDSTKSMKFQSVRLEPSIRQCLLDPTLQSVLPALIAGGME
jgi:hypothetical protein